MSRKAAENWATHVMKIEFTLNLENVESAIAIIKIKKALADLDDSQCFGVVLDEKNKISVLAFFAEDKISYELSEQNDCSVIIIKDEIEDL